LQNIVKIPSSLAQLRVAIVHEWFVNYAGSERVVEQLLNVFPQAELFSLVDFLPEHQRFYIKEKKITTSFIQRLPFARKHFRNYFPWFPVAVESYDLRGFDIVISSSHLAAKGIIINQDQLHICYCHSPCRFAWDLYHQYLEESGLKTGLKGIISQFLLSRLRIWDQINTNRVQYFIANSSYIGNRIKHVYQRNSTVIHPPVDTKSFDLTTEKGDYYFAASRLVPYKKLDLIVEAFSKMPERKLVVVGSGPDVEKVKKFLRPNIDFKSEVDSETFRIFMQGAKAFVFAAEEDFGITMAEALAAGTPVIAFGKGGSKDIVVDGETGVLFPEQTVDSIISAVEFFENVGVSKNSSEIRSDATQFSQENFQKKIADFVLEKWTQFKS
jgi:glycosyltransferase involved in cell wall biosynthesis